MAENSKIEWTEHTFNPWMGCTKVSGACKHCYAETLMDTRWGKVQWGPKGSRVRTSDANWRKPLTWDRKAESEGRRMRVFCASLADVFEGADTMPAGSVAVVEEARRDLWALIEATPHLDWLLLTKRPENVRGMVPDYWVATKEDVGCGWTRDVQPEWPSNAWIGTTIEDQQSADERIPHLLKIPARVRFLSCEPLLGSVDLAGWLGTIRPILTHLPTREGLRWVIAGGESGPGARPSHPDWFRSLRDQCQEAEVPFFFKQWGAWVTEDDAPAGTVERHPRPRLERLDGVTVGRVGKHAAGRLLDGRTWDEVPRD